jgi:diguanylate cyclase (GGDEF)-like protein
MAASDPNQCLDPLSGEGFTCLSAPSLHRRLEEEIARAERQESALSCLLVVIENLEEVSREHGRELSEQMLAYVGSALQRELRRFDRIGRPSERELLIVLPGADARRGEMVARRVLDRVRSIKLEADGTRRPLLLSVGIAAWHSDASAAELLTRARAATRLANGNGNGNSEGLVAPAQPPGGWPGWQAPGGEEPPAGERPDAGEDP